MSKQTSNCVILALGLFSPVVDGEVINRGFDGIIEAARKSFPDKNVTIVTIRELTDFKEQFEWLSEDLQNGKYRGIASAFYVQEALEGSHSITDIHYDLTGMDSVIVQSHAGSELRSLIAHVAAFFPRKVNIHFRTEDGLATVNKDSEKIQGVKLPDWVYSRLQINR